MAEAIAEGIQQASPNTTIKILNAVKNDKNDILVEATVRAYVVRKLWSAALWAYRASCCVKLAVCPNCGFYKDREVVVTE